MAVIWWLDYVNYTCYVVVCFISLIAINLRQLHIVFLRCLWHLKLQVGNIAVFSSVLQFTYCHIVQKFTRESCQAALIFNSHIKGVTLPLGHQYSPFLETPRPTPSILCYNTQTNALSSYYTIVMCWSALLCDAGSLTQFLKLHVTIKGSCTEKQWPP